MNFIPWKLSGWCGCSASLLLAAVGFAADVVPSDLAPDEVREGAALTLRAEVDGGTEPLVFQWFKDGAPLSDATTAILRFEAIRREDAGVYQVSVRNAYGEAVSPLENVRVRASPRAALANVSLLLAGSSEVAAGFTLGGAATRGETPVLLRAAGPALSQFGVTNAFADPVLKLVENGRVLDANDDWSAGPVPSHRAAQVGAFPFPAASHDAALDAALAVGSYGLEVRDAGSGGGTTAIEVYDARGPGANDLPRLVNLSARALVTSGGRILAGFTVQGEGEVTLLIRGIGPGLRAFGVSNPLADPRLTVFRGGSPADSADQWEERDSARRAEAATRVGAFALAPGSADAALVMTVTPGSYSLQLEGADAGSGVALVEIYEIPPL